MIGDAHTVALWLIKQCNETNAETMTITETNVTSPNGPIGDWEVEVRRIKNPVATA